VFTPFHKPPYTYPYGRSVDKTMTVDSDYIYLVSERWTIVVAAAVVRMQNITVFRGSTT
jgi:hypothetical protein